MKIRSYQHSDAATLKRIADASGFPYEPPESPLIEVCLVLTDDDGEILAASAAKKILELYFWKDSYLSPATTKTAIDLFHTEMGTVLRNLGYHEANTFLHPSICERFGRRLQRTWGWVRNWPSFAVKF